MNVEENCYILRLHVAISKIAIPKIAIPKIAFCKTRYSDTVKVFAILTHAQVGGRGGLITTLSRC